MTKQRGKTMAKPRISSPETEEKYRICLERFQDWMEKNNKSPNTVRVYLAALRQYFELYPSVNPENLMLYKCYLIDHYKTRTVNQRIRAINSYVEFLDLPYSRLFMIRQQQKPFSLLSVPKEGGITIGCLFIDDPVQAVPISCVLLAEHAIELMTE